MATTLHKHWERTVAPEGPDATVVRSFTTTTALAASDVLKLLRVPRGRKVVDAWMRASDIDTHATPTVVLTLRTNDGSAQKAIIHQSTVGQGGGLARPTKIAATEPGLGYTFDDGDYWIEVFVDTVAATPAAGAIQVGVTLSGYRDPGDITE